MSTEKFIIDNRFTVDFSRNLVHDIKNNIETKFEPRLGNLLFIFIQKQGEVVSREYLIEKIWDNYLGANEGLNQAISFLRKLLDDNEKKIIVTFPKKGYSFNAVVSKILEDTIKKQLPIKTYLTAAVLFFILGITVYYLIQTLGISTKPKQTPGLTQQEMSKQNAGNQAASISNKKNVSTASFDKQNDQSQSNLIKMSDEDAKRTALSTSK